MITNEQMTANRYGKKYFSKKLFAKIQETLKTGGAVQVCTMTKATQYDSRHIDMFVLKPSGVYVKRGKSFDFIELCMIRFGRAA